MINLRNLLVVATVAHLATAAPVNNADADPVVGTETIKFTLKPSPQTTDEPAVVVAAERRMAASIDLKTVKFEPGKFVTLVASPQATGQSSSQEGSSDSKKDTSNNNKKGSSNSNSQESPGVDTSNGVTSNDETSGDDGSGVDGSGVDTSGVDTSGDGSSGDDTLGDDSSAHGTSGDGSSGDGSSGDGTSGDGTSGDGSSGDGTSGDGTSGDGTSGDGTSGDDASGDDSKTTTGDDSKGSCVHDTKGTSSGSKRATTDSKGTSSNTKGSSSDQTKDSCGKDTKGSSGTDTKGSSGTDTKGSSGTDTKGSSGTDTKGSSGTDTKGSSGTDTKGSSGTDTKGSSGTDTKGSSGTGTKGSGSGKKGNATATAEAAAVKTGQSLLDKIASEIKAPDTQSPTHLNLTTYQSMATVDGLIISAAATINIGFPIEQPEVIAFFKDTAGDRPYGKNAGATLYTHGVTIQPGIANQSQSLLQLTNPVFMGMVSAKKDNGALIMVDYNTSALAEVGSLVTDSSKPIILHQHLGAAAENYAATGNPFPVQWVATTANIIDKAAIAVLNRVVSRNDWKVPNQANRYQLSVSGSGDEGKLFRELGASVVGKTVFTAMADYHKAFSDNQPLKLHIYSEGKTKPDSNYLIWELGKST
jgi:hypothetical protein